MLVTNGCSFVWGDELEGYDDQPSSHHDQTFAYQLAEKLEVPLTNLATCGACNHKIYRDTLNFIMKNGKDITHLVIIWSAWQRDEMAMSMPREEEERLKIQRWECMTQISPTRLSSIPEPQRSVMDDYYLGAHDPRTDIVHQLTYMKHMQLTCDLLGIKICQGAFHERMWQNVLGIMHPKHNTKEEDDCHWGDLMDTIERDLIILRDECRIGLGRYIDMFQLARTQHNIHEFGHPDKHTHAEYALLLEHIFRTQT